MSALWVLSLGASVGYLLFKRQAIGGRMQEAVQEYESGKNPSEDGATWKEVKHAWRDTDHLNNDFNERLPDSDKRAILKSESAAESTALNYDRQQGQVVDEIEGIHIDLVGAS